MKLAARYLTQYKNPNHYEELLECCSFVKTFSYLCELDGFKLSDITYCESVFRESLNENVVVFNAKGRYGLTLTSCRF